MTSKRNRELNVQRDLLKMFEPDGPKSFRGGITDDETFLYFSDIPIQRSNQMWVAADGKRPVLLPPDFQSRKRLLLVFVFVLFFNTQGPVMVDSLPQKSKLTVTYCAETVLPQVVKSIRQQHQIVDTSKTPPSRQRRCSQSQGH